MNPINLALGAIKLPSLFSTCLDLIEKIDDYRHFRDDERALAIQLASHKLRFKRWGKALGLSRETIDLSEKRHEALTDPETLQTLRQIIDAAQEILYSQQGKNSQDDSDLRNGLGAENGSSPAGSLVQVSRTTTKSRMTKFAWALRGKSRREKQVELFGRLVQHLYYLLPVDALPQLMTGLAVQDGLQTVTEKASWASEMKTVLNKLEDQAETEILRDLHTWLSQYPPNEIFEEALQARLDDTCGWILERPIFQNWFSLQEGEAKPKLLWINGPAGFGKTILCAGIVEHLLATAKTPVAYFFFSSDFESRNDPYEAIRCWISSVMSQNKIVFDCVRMSRGTQLGSAATRTVTMRLLEEIVHILPGCIFIIDGLDECTWLGKDINRATDSITHFFEHLDHAIADSATRVIIASRDEPIIRAGIQNMDSSIFEHKIVPDDINNDIHYYSRSIVEKKLFKKSEVIKEEISQKIAMQCAGQFLWLKLQENSLRGWKNLKQLQDAIDKTPSGLEGLYQRNWARMSQLPEEERNRAFTLLRWVTFAAKPLTVAELAEAALISVDSNQYPRDDLPDAIDEEYINSEILGLCGSLLSIYDNPSDSGSSTKRENTSIAQICLRYIQCEEAWGVRASNVSGQIQGSFRDYAAEFWYRHAREADQEDGLMNKLIDALFDSDDVTTWERWREYYDAKEKSRAENLTETPLETFTQPGRVFYAAKLNLTNLTLRLIEKHPDHLDDRSIFGETALAAACSNGNEQIAQTLISSGADISLATWSGQTPLHLAARNGHLKLVRILLKSGSEVNSVDFRKATPLHSAAEAKQTEIAELLLQYGANVIAVDIQGHPPLYSALRRNDINMAQLFIAAAPDQIKLAGKYYRWLPLHFAAHFNISESMRLLLDCGANPDLVSDQGSTGEIVHLLIEKGADLNIPDGSGRTAVIFAAWNKNSEMIRELVENGAKLNMVDANVDSVRILLNAGADQDLLMDNTGSSPLFLALLLKNGANPETETAGYKTPLCTAILGHHIEVVKLLLEHGADSTAVFLRSELIPSELAAGLGQILILELLLNHGVDLDTMRILLDKGADITAVDNGGRSALFYAARKGADYDRWTAIHYAAHKGLADIVPTLIELGSLFHAAERGHIETIHILLDAGLTTLDQAEDTELIRDQLRTADQASINQAEAEGRTPLFNAAMRGYSDIVELLISRNADTNKRDRYNSSALFAALLLAIDQVALDHEDCFGRTVFSWAYRSKNHELIKLLELAAAKKELEVQCHVEISAPLESYIFDSDASWCDICTRCVQLNAEYFECKPCADFLICSECATAGLKCRDISHEWESRLYTPEEHSYDD
ncbi:ankyrin repeat-containing domain protein [Trichoderma austrokoningii]